MVKVSSHLLTSMVQLRRDAFLLHALDIGSCRALRHAPTLHESELFPRRNVEAITVEWRKWNQDLPLPGSGQSSDSSRQVKRPLFHLVRSVSSSHAMVAEPGSSDYGHAIPAPSTRCPDPDGCIDNGLGAFFEGHTKRGRWDKDTAKSHINWLELQAVFLTLWAFLPRLRGRVVRWHIDNATAIAYLAKQGGTRSRALNALAERILLLAFHNQVTIIPVHLAGARNVLADLASRSGLVVPREWTLHPDTFRQVSQIAPLGPP